MTLVTTVCGLVMTTGSMFGTVLVKSALPPTSWPHVSANPPSRSSSLHRLSPLINPRTPTRQTQSPLPRPSLSCYDTLGSNRVDSFPGVNFRRRSFITSLSPFLSSAVTCWGVAWRREAGTTHWLWSSLFKLCYQLSYPMPNLLPRRLTHSRRESGV